MSIHVTGASSLSQAETQRLLTEATTQRADVFQYFWVSKIYEPTFVKKEDSLAHGLKAVCAFLIKWNSDDGFELIAEAPQILYRTFGVKNLLMFDNDGEMIPPATG
jgi:hypothetical protein